MVRYEYRYGYVYDYGYVYEYMYEHGYDNGYGSVVQVLRSSWCNADPSILQVPLFTLFLFLDSLCFRYPEVLGTADTLKPQELGVYPGLRYSIYNHL